MNLGAMVLNSREEFQSWLMNDLDRREELYELMGGDPGIGLASLDALEAFLLTRYATPEEALRLDQRAVLDAAARHVGLVMILSIDAAAWDLEPAGPEMRFDGLPVIGFADGSVECPLTVTIAALLQRSGRYLRVAVTSWTTEFWHASD